MITLPRAYARSTRAAKQPAVANAGSGKVDVLEDMVQGDVREEAQRSDEGGRR